MSMISLLVRLFFRWVFSNHDESKDWPGWLQMLVTLAVLGGAGWLVWYGMFGKPSP